MEYSTLSANDRRFLPPAVAVSSIAFALTPPDPDQDRVAAAATGPASLWIPLVRRTRAPYEGRWALPGGATQWDETLAATAQRTLVDAVGRCPAHLEQLYSFGGVERSANAQRLVTIAYWALYNESAQHNDDAVGAQASQNSPSETAAVGSGRRWDDPEPREQARGHVQQAAPDALQLSAAPAEVARNVAWFAVDDLPELAFDHAEIVAHALDRLRSKTEYAQVAHRFLGDAFTLAQLRHVHEAVQGRAVDPANFRRQALAQGTLQETGGCETGTRHRPAKLYRFAPEAA